MKISSEMLWLLGVIISLLLTMIGFFLKSLVKKFDEGNRTLTHIDKTLAVMDVTVKGHDERLGWLFNENEKQNNEISTLRETVHILSARPDMSEHIVELIEALSKNKG